MRSIYLFGIIASLLIFSAITFVYAHGTDSQSLISSDDYEGMDEMHEEMMQLIDDPELVEAMNEMHEDNCIQSAKGSKYIAVEDNMMTGNNQIRSSSGMMGGMMIGGMM